MVRKVNLRIFNLLIDKYLINSFKYHIKEISKLVFKFDKDYLEHFVWTEDKTLDLIKDNFKVEKVELIPKKEGKCTRNFMMILKD